ncbi:hypothetical protein EW093_00765 [Thiospirochaeta perfilievii]|uniref:DNA 3'-5' helicase n=1 Tax=Thiospirochaeta perfilievii TaxID=252967 RepID=A0A5C1Q8T9_9SPIO|nr:UvrD-helicase domain-containing protein [Thiospirochaeta perfilievii]QEN03296.1 hypothetical protein EW093_00765 [Thiospirochaeta perfilievii]
MSNTVLKDQDIRNKITGETSDQDLKRAQFVKAGAGAGKTYSIKHRVLNLVRKLKIDPERMVIITYTTKAANELLTRIREELEKQGEREALEKLPHAKISTFHSFCYDLLREYPIEFGLDPDLELADEGTTQIMLENCFHTMEEDSQLVEDAAVAADLFSTEKELYLETLEKLKPEDLNKLKKTLLVLYQNRDLTPYRINCSSLRDSSHIKTDIESNIREYYNLAHELIKNIKPGNEDDKLYRFIMDDMYSEISVLSEDEYLTTILERDHVQRAGNMGRKPAFKDGDLVTSFKTCTKASHDLKIERDAIASIHNYNRSIDLFKYFNDVVDRYKKASGVIDFFDCLNLVKKALDENDLLRDLVQKRFDTVIIDEFQDSDPMQADIAFHLAGDNPNKLFFVGDPKQSIYSFARADISVYIEVMKRVEKIQGGEILNLTTNFRSSEGLLNFINNNFSTILSGLDYKNMNLAAKNRDLSSTIEKWITYPKLEGEDSCGSDLIHEREAFIVAKDIEESISSGEFKPGDFLILFRSGSHMAKYEDALNLLDIPVINTKSKGFLNQSEIIELLNILALCAYPTDRYFRFAVKNSYLYNIENSDLDTVLSSNCSFISKFRSLTGKSGLVALAINSNKPDYINFIENLIVITSRELTASDYNLNLTISKLFEKAFNDMPWGEEGIADESLYIESVKPNSVRLMTIHSAKGLEAKVVFLCAHSGKSFKADKYVNRKDNSILPPSPFISKTGSENLNLNDLTILYEKAETIKKAEDRRLLYVAVTRAKSRFVLLCKESGNYSFIDPLINGTGYEAISKNFSDYNEEYQSIDRYQQTDNNDYSFGENLSSIGELIGENSSSVAVTTLIEDKDIFANVSGRKNGLEFGTFVHRIMENICTLIFHNKSKDMDIDTILEKLHSTNEFKFTNYIDEIKEMLQRFIKSDLVSEIITADNIQTELMFSGAENYHGIMDLFLEKGNIIKIVDFKSDILGGNAAEIKEHYNKQMDYYTNAVKNSYVDKIVTGECIYLFSEEK